MIILFNKYHCNVLPDLETVLKGLARALVPVQSRPWIPRHFLCTKDPSPSLDILVAFLGVTRSVVPMIMQISYSSGKEKNCQITRFQAKKASVKSSFSPGKSEKKMDQQEIPRWNFSEFRHENFAVILSQNIIVTLALKINYPRFAEKNETDDFVQNNMSECLFTMLTNVYLFSFCIVMS